MSGTLMFEPLQLNGLHLKNRIIKSATHDGGDFEEFRKTYVRLAKNDVALITVAYVAVSSVNKTFDNQHHIGPDNLEEWSALTSSVRAAGGKMSAQLHHPGLFNMSTTGTPMGPSFFYLPSKAAWPRTMSLDDLHGVREEFVAAAVHCKQAGFECVELHCGHGYLLSQFLTPVINRRSDAYGGSAEKRAQFPVEVATAIREALGPDFPVVVKLNAEDGLPFPGGLCVEDALVAARRLADEAKVDAVIPSFGYTSLNGFGMLRGGVPLEKMTEALPSAPARFIARTVGSKLVPKIDFEPLFLRDLNRRFVDALKGSGTRVIYVGGADSFRGIEDVLGDGNCAVQLGRPLLREPYFIKKIQRELLAADRPEDVDCSSRCIRCNMCTLASIDPERFKAGCVFLKPTDGADIEDLAVPRL